MEKECCIAIYGSSGFGREVYPLVRAQHGSDTTDIVFVDDNSATSLSFPAFLERPERSKKFVIAIANSLVRERLTTKCLTAGLEPICVRAANVVTLDDIDIKEGAILCAFSHVTSTVRIGRYFHANYYSYVAHDCVIGDYVTLAPGAKINGNVHIDDHAYVGAGAIIKQGTPANPRTIGKHAVIGMGAVVTKDVAANETVVGNPGRPVEKH